MGFVDFDLIFKYFILFQVNDTEEQTFEIKAVYFHEQYNVGVYLNHDIAILKLRPNSRTGKGVKFGERVVPACLPHTNVVYGPHLNCTVAGWGSRGLKDPGSTRYLQSAHIPYLGIIDFTP